LQDQGLYNVAFAVHTGGVGGRWHLVSLPLTMGLGRNDGDIQVVRNPAGVAEALLWHEIDLIHPGQVTWQWLHSDHPGRELVEQGEAGVHDMHTSDDLGRRILEREGLSD
jgi:hypothetical protein